MKLKRLFSESITFSVPSEAQKAKLTPCRKCGLTPKDAKAAQKQEYEEAIASGLNPNQAYSKTYDKVDVCDYCYSLGGDINEYELNVANGNARVILDILGYDEYGGDMDPKTVIAKLSMLNPNQHTREYKKEQDVKLTADGVGLGPTVINMGLDQEQIQRYAEVLLKMANKALEHGEPIVYG